MKKFFTSEKLSSLLVFFFCLFLFSSSSIAQWVSQPNGFKPRSEVSSVMYKGKIYAFFGFRDSELTIVEPSAEVYDPATKTWTLLASAPSSRAVTHAPAVVIDDKVWHIGGRVGKHPGPFTSQILIYNITTNVWSLGPQLIDPATGKTIPWAAGGAALLGRTLHVFGGMIIGACNNTTTGSGDQQKYHLTLNVDEWLANPSQPAHWKNELPPMPVKRNHLSTVVLGGKIYAIGGQYGHDCGGGLDKPYVHVYNPATKTWSQLTSLPTPRSHTEASSFAIDGKIYVVGGQATNAASCAKVTIFDPAANYGTGAWRDDTNLTLPKVFETVSAKVIGSNFIISHGGQPEYNNPSRATYSRTITRAPVYKLGFLPTCATAKIAQGKSIKLKTLLFTIDGSKSYTTSSNAGWLKVTRKATGTAIQTAVDLEVTVNATGLAPGTYQGTITATGASGGTYYTAAKYCVNLTVLSANTMEAENAYLYQLVVASNHSGYTGTGFVDFINSTRDFLEWWPNKSSSGAVSMKFRYANGSAYNRPLRLDVNGVTVASSLAFPPTGSWNNWSTVSITTNLIAGTNEVRLTAIGSSGPNIDNLVWYNATSSSNLAFGQNQDMRTTTDATADFRASVAPNPAYSMAKLYLTGFSNASVEISIANASGAIYKTFSIQSLNNGSFDFSVQNMPTGLYIILVRQDNKQASAKLVVGNR